MNQYCFIKRIAAMALVLVIAFGLLPTGALGAERSSAISKTGGLLLSW